MVTTDTVWVSVSSHRSRGKLTSITADPGPSYGIWPEGEWPRGEYFEVPAKHADALGRVKGLRVLRGKPAGGRLFERLTSAELGGPEPGNWPVPEQVSEHDHDH